ncbi:hypothetical protein D3Y57_09995 [Sphingomonas paeninsulae]|uniref:Uncharacterized protein n=1 Tax=Sphingomonas paeninsulae TaxID=2319844 RepID=A0A494TFT1_SPHPE|nr:hypothetical protein [Sphingomonas paeninsulae]AYJ86234.1 hypothetical protein D3Y57_09995 [Sphingomonas paeninsulae]
MNALIPVFVAVLLAEIGGPLAIFGRERRNSAALAMIVLIVVAVIGGWSIAALLIGPARLLMLGLALLFAGVAQFGRRAVVTGTPTILASAMTLYRSPAPFLAFAFAAWMTAPISAGTGAMIGVGVAAAVGSLGFTVRRGLCIGAGIILCIAGLFAVLSGLRLV